MPTIFGPHFRMQRFSFATEPRYPGHGFAKWVDEGHGSITREFHYLLPTSYIKPGDDKVSTWRNQTNPITNSEWVSFVEGFRTSGVAYEFGIGKVQEYARGDFKDTFAEHFPAAVFDDAASLEPVQFNDGFIELADPDFPNIAIGGVAVRTSGGKHYELWQLLDPTSFPRDTFLAKFDVSGDPFARLHSQSGISQASTRLAVATTFTANGLPPR